MVAVIWRLLVPEALAAEAQGTSLALEPPGQPTRAAEEEEAAAHKRRNMLEAPVDPGSLL